MQHHWLSAFSTEWSGPQRSKKRRAPRPRHLLRLEQLEERLAPSAASLVADINTLHNPASSFPGALTAVNGTVFFTADVAGYGKELWKSDGSAAGTVLVKDINPGSQPSSPRNLTNVNGTLFFSANDGASGEELWKSDGTAAGTVLVKDIRAGSASSTPSLLTNVNGTLFFAAFDGVSGGELWTSDGTAAGTVLVKDILPGSASSNLGFLTDVNGTLFFSAFDGIANGVELWKSDGSAAGTVLVKDIRPGGATSDPRYLTNVNGTLFFTATDGVTGVELWQSDGTTAGTVLVKDIVPGPNSSGARYLTNVNGTLFFRADDGVNGIELWQSEGSAAGTVLVKDINPGSASSIPFDLENVNGTLFFTATDGVNGSELWKSDGSAAGTVLVKDIVPGSGSSTPGLLTNVNGTLFFVATDGVNGSELWRSDGSAAGTVLVKDILPGSVSSSPSYLANVNGTLFLRATDGVNGSELWKSDGSAAGTVLVKDISDGNLSSTPGSLTNVNGTLFFTANDGVHGSELWKSDGSAAGTVLVKDINPGSATSFVGSLTNFSGTLFFAASDGVNGIELWRSDGSAAGTVLVKDISPGSGSSTPSSLTNVNGTLFFAASDGVNGGELWRSDGTAAGTVLVKDISPGSSSPNFLTNVNGTLFFSAVDTNNRELWKSDGTAAGTVLVKDINPTTLPPFGFNQSSNPNQLTNVNGTLFFSATDGVNGIELWKSDGTAAGTVLVRNLNPGSANFNPVNLTSVNGTVFFTGDFSATGMELWKSDGTVAGTVLVRDINPGSAASTPINLTNFNGTLFFNAFNSVNGAELWQSDGTAAGTVFIDINPGTASSSPIGLTNINGTLFFTANDGVSGEELWQSDGSAAGTVLASDNFPGSGGSNVVGLTLVNNNLFFSALDKSHGTELWALELNVAPSTLAINSGTINENDVFTVTGSFTDLNAGDVHTVTVNWGEGAPEVFVLPTGARTFSFTHQYLDDNPSATASDNYRISVTVTDGDGASTAATRASFLDDFDDNLLDGWSTVVGGGAVSVAGGVVSFTGPASPTPNPPTSAEIDHSLAVDGDFTVSADFTQLGADGSEWRMGLSLDFGPIRMTLHDTDSPKAWYVNFPGTVHSSDVNGTAGLENQTETLQIRRTGTLFTFSVIQGGVETIITQQAAPAEFQGTLTGAALSAWSHSSPLSATVDNFRLDGGGITVNNVAPSSLVVNDGTINENDVFTLTGSFTDPGTLDVHTVTVNWGDGSPVENVVLPVGDRTFSIPHRYLDDNPSGTSSDIYPVSVTVAADDGGSVTAPTPHLLAWWQADGDAGDALLAHDGSLINGAGFTPGIVGQAFHFDGVDDYVIASAAGFPVGSSDRTMALWVRVDSVVAMDAIFAGYGAFGSTNQASVLAMSGTTLIYANWSDAPIFGPTLNLGQWYHVAVATEGNFATLYLDGVAVASGASTHNTAAGTPFIMGRIPGPLGDSRRLNGALDDVQVYGTVLSASQIQAIYAAGAAGLDSALAPAQVLVNNVAPTFEAGADETLPTGSGAFSRGDIAIVDPGTLDTFTGSVDYDDGMGPQTLTINPDRTFDLSHTYVTSGTYHVSVTINDDDLGTHTDMFDVFVNLNTAPIANAGAPCFVNEGASVTLDGSGSTDAEQAANTLIYEWDYDYDGVTFVVDATGANSVFASTDGLANHTLALRVTDNGNLSSIATTTLAENNVAPTLTISGAASVNEGSSYTLNLSSSDPGADTIDHWTITWDDGDVETVSGNPSSVSHTYADGTINRTISATATDEDGTFSANTIVVAVNNVAPTLTISGPPSVDEGSSYVLNLSSSDPGTDTIDHWTITWDDGDVETVSGNPSSVSHTYADGTINRTISATATDEDGTFSANTIVVAVNNVAPTLTISGPPSVDEGSSYVLNLSSSDPGTDTIDHWTITWDDGDVETVSGNPSSVSHTYADGTINRTISATATDEDGTFSANTVVVAVNNVAPTLTISGPPSVDEGSSYVLNLSSSDPGTDTIDHWTITWDDGDVQTVSGNPASVSHTYADGTINRTISATATDEDGTFSANTIVVAVNNVAPTAGITGPATANTGEVVVFTFTATDPGTIDQGANLTFEIDWDGDGVVDQIVVGLSGTQVTHSFADAGSYDIELTATDRDGAISPGAVFTIDVGMGGGGPGDGGTAVMVGNDLVITGTDAADRIHVRRGAVAGAVVVRINGVSLGTFTPTGQIVIHGLGGNDCITVGCRVTIATLIDGGLGDDLIYGGGGNDTFVDMSGNNQIHAGRGNDTVTTGSGADRIWTGGGDDFINTGDGNNEIHAGDGNDTIITGNGDDEIRAGDGNDVINAGNGLNDIRAGSGNDRVFAGNGRDIIDAGSGDDYVQAGAGHDSVQAGSGDDILVGGDGDDLLIGNDGRDLLIGGIGADRIVGNKDEDILIAGYTCYDGNELALTSIMSEWTACTSYSSRTANILAGTGLAAGYRLNGNDGASQTVFNDTSVDILTGSQGQDWFLANLVADNGGPLDNVTDKSASELWSDTDF